MEENNTVNVLIENIHKHEYQYRKLAESVSSKLWSFMAG